MTLFTSDIVAIVRDIGSVPDSKVDKSLAPAILGKL